MEDVRRWVYKGTKYMVNDRSERMNNSLGSIAERSIGRIALHHYCTKSLQVPDSAE